jgi:DNA-binding NtrC family response regulator
MRTPESDMDSQDNPPDGPQARILVVETLCDILSLDNYSITSYDPSMPDAPVLHASYDVVLLDVFIPNTDGFALREEILKFSPYAQFIIMTGRPDRTLLDKAIDLGAYTFLIKPFNQDQIRYSVMAALRMTKLLKTSREREVFTGTQTMGLIGISASIVEIRRMISKIAPLDIPVMVFGESGTGKEVVARCIHEYSRRSGGRLTVVNCAGLSPGLIESELFGHEQGAFTGAMKTKHGYFEITDGGTLFLDEIGELPLELQSKLLHVLDHGEFNRVGDTRVFRTDVRIVCATNRNLKTMTDEGTFRKDLYFRLHGAQITLRPLRERKEDIPALIRHFLEDDHYAIVPDAIAMLQSYEWPGNVRQLKMVVAGLRGLAVNRTIGKESVSRILETEEGQPAGGEVLAYKEFKQRVVFNAEKEYFQSLVESSDGNITHAARCAGMDRKNFYEKLKQLGILH